MSQVPNGPTSAPRASGTSGPPVTSASSWRSGETWRVPRGPTGEPTRQRMPTAPSTLRCCSRNVDAWQMPRPRTHERTGGDTRRRQATSACSWPSRAGGQTPKPRSGVPRAAGTRTVPATSRPCWQPTAARTSFRRALQRIAGQGPGAGALFPPHPCRQPARPARPARRLVRAAPEPAGARTRSSPQAWRPSRSPGSESLWPHPEAAQRRRPATRHLWPLMSPPG
jgi:hypothetical protein